MSNRHKFVKITLPFAHLKSKKELAKDRGNDLRSDGAVYICSYNENAVVSVASNCYTYKPVGTVKRYSIANKCKIDATELHIIKKYK